MYLFWFIPIGIAMIALIWGLFAAIKRQPLSTSNGRVLTDKPADKSQPRRSG